MLPREACQKQIIRENFISFQEEAKQDLLLKTHVKEKVFFK